MDWNVVVSYPDTYFLQLFLFQIPLPKLAEYKAVEMVDAEDENRKVQTVPDKPFKMRANDCLI